MPKDTGEFIISKSMNLRLPPIFGYTAFLFIPRQVRFSQSLSHMGKTQEDMKNLQLHSLWVEGMVHPLKKLHSEKFCILLEKCKFLIIRVMS